MSRISPAIARGYHALDQGGAWFGMLGIRRLLSGPGRLSINHAISGWLGRGR